MLLSLSNLWAGRNYLEQFPSEHNLKIFGLPQTLYLNGSKMKQTLKYCRYHLCFRCPKDIICWSAALAPCLWRCDDCVVDRSALYAQAMNARMKAFALDWNGVEVSELSFVGIFWHTWIIHELGETSLETKIAYRIAEKDFILFIFVLYSAFVSSKVSLSVCFLPNRTGSLFERCVLFQIEFGFAACV